MNRETKSYVCANINDTDEFVIRLLNRINFNSVVLLNGDVGTGKTYICSQIASHFGIKDFASSSFQRVNEYTGNVNIIHCDFYRSQCEYEFFLQEIDPLLQDPWILLIEWFNLKYDIIECDQFFEITLKHGGGSNRLIEITELNLLL